MVTTRSRRRGFDWRSDGPQVVGAAMLVFCLAFWALTDRVEPLFVTTGGGLLGLGLGAEALAELRRPPDPPRVEAAETAGEDEAA